MRVSLLLLPLGLLACDPGKPTLDGDDTSGTTDSADTDTDTDSDTDADTDTDSDTDTDPNASVHDLSWRLHEDIESLVYTTWTQDTAANVHVEYSFDDGEWMQSPSFTGQAGVNEQLLVGIPYATNADWRVVVEGGDSQDGPTITTGDLPNGLPIGDVTVSDDATWRPHDKYLLTSINERTGGWTGGHYWTFIIDRQARVLWAHEAPNQHWTLFVTVSRTGDYFMWDEATYWSDYDDGRDSTIHRTYLDREIEEVATPGLHHTFLQLPDGSLVWGSQDHGGSEALVERSPGEEGERILWTCDDDWPGAGRCESNGLFYNESTDSFLYSFYTNNSIVEVDHQTGESLWWAGDVRDGYSFDPRGFQYSWQHGITYTDSGSLLVSSEPPEGKDRETWLLEYEVDHENRQLHYFWGSGANAFASTNGDAWRLDNGNTLHVVGAAGVIREVDPDGSDVWRVDFHGTNLLGRGEYIEDLYTLVSPRE